MAVPTDRGGELRFSLLGPLRLWRGGKEIEAGPRQQRLILALLLARGGRLVEIHEFVQLLWNGEPPPTAGNMIQRYVGGLRRLIEPDLPRRTAARVLLSDLGGYRLTLPEEACDLQQFRAAVAAAQSAAESGDTTTAWRSLCAGLELWRGRVAAGLGPAVENCPDLVGIEREYANAVRGAADLALDRGEGAQILPALREAVSWSPFDEALQTRLLRVLAADSKQAEAVERYGEIRRRLATRLGATPGAELQAAYRAVLRAGEPTAAPRPTRRPAQQPADLAAFAGRVPELREASTRLTAPGPGVAVVTVDGLAGVGKTTLAVHLAHRMDGHFPGGQLHAHLRGLDPGRHTDPAAVLQEFLMALGVDRTLVPDDLDQRAAMYRRVTAGRRLLVLLDDAADADQVRPLLPGSGGNSVVVTSRTRLLGLPAVLQAHQVSLDVLTRPEAELCLERRLGSGRVEAERAAVAEILDRCHGHPLALAIMAARASTDGSQYLTSIAADLRRRRETMDAFADEAAGVGLREVFDQSRRLLSVGATHLLTALARQPGPSLRIDDVAAAAGVSLVHTRAYLAELTRHRLVDRRDNNEYALHQLVRIYAAEGRRAGFRFAS